MQIDAPGVEILLFADLPMSPQRLAALLDAIRLARVGVIGDFCLDAYWTLDPAGCEISIETGKPTQAVRHQRYELGGAGNVVNNLAALGVGADLRTPAVHAFAVVGDDLFGREMNARLAARGVSTAGVCMQRSHWDTPVYGKPYVGDEEQSRLDFGGFNHLAPETEQALLAALTATLKPRTAESPAPQSADSDSAMRMRSASGTSTGPTRDSVQALIINQQLARGIHSPNLVAGLNHLIAAHPECIFIVDSRQHSDQFGGAILKVNASEAARLTSSPSAASDRNFIDTLRKCARELHRRTHQPVFITRGEHGLLAFDGQEFADVPGIPITGPVDPVGAGDTAVASIAAALAARATVAEAAELANLAAAVTVQKLKQCGTATAEEIVALGRACA